MFVIRFFGLLLKLSTAQVQFLASTTTLSISIISKQGKRKMLKLFYTATPVAELPKGGEKQRNIKKVVLLVRKPFHFFLIRLYVSTFPSSKVTCLHPKLKPAVPREGCLYIYTSEVQLCATRVQYTVYCQVKWMQRTRNLEQGCNQRVLQLQAYYHHRWPRIDREERQQWVKTGYDKRN